MDSFSTPKTVVIEFGHWTRYVHVVYISAIVLYCTDGLSGVVLSFMYPVSIVVLMIYLVSYPLFAMLQSLRTQAYALLFNTPGKLRLSLFTGDGMFCTPVWFFVIVLMIYPVSSSLTHAPIPKDPSVHSVVEYTREAEIKSAY